ncbi:MAG TPA: hypothetical protein VM537_33820, partial [Anaerolineae bacterium]|nr:hypothetical protein [Anaerolineae bacterium]
MVKTLDELWREGREGERVVEIGIEYGDKEHREYSIKRDVVFPLNATIEWDAGYVESLFGTSEPGCYKFFIRRVEPEAPHEEERDCGGTGIAVIGYKGDEDIEGKCPGCSHPDCPTKAGNPEAEGNAVDRLIDWIGRAHVLDKFGEATRDEFVAAARAELARLRKEREGERVLELSWAEAGFHVVSADLDKPFEQRRRLSFHNPRNELELLFDYAGKETKRYTIRPIEPKVEEQPTPDAAPEGDAVDD